MKLFNQIRIYLDGKKTYILSVLAVLDGGYQYYIQHGSNIHTLIAYLLTGGTVAALRAAIAKTTN